MEQTDQTTAAGASVDHDAHRGLLDDLMGRVAPCFARRETRMTCRDMVHGLLSEVEDRNCWTLAGAAGHSCPYRMRHLLSRARCDEQRMLDIAARWAVDRLSAGRDRRNAVLIVDETADEKSSADYVLSGPSSRGIPSAALTRAARRPESGRSRFTTPAARAARCLARSTCTSASPWRSCGTAGSPLTMGSTQVPDKSTAQGPRARP